MITRSWIALPPTCAEDSVVAKSTPRLTLARVLTTAKPHKEGPIGGPRQLPRARDHYPLGGDLLLEKIQWSCGFQQRALCSRCSVDAEQFPLLHPAATELVLSLPILHHRHKRDPMRRRGRLRAIAPCTLSRLG